VASEMGFRGHFAKQRLDGPNVCLGSIASIRGEDTRGLLPQLPESGLSLLAFPSGLPGSDAICAASVRVICNSPAPSSGDGLTLPLSVQVGTSQDPRSISYLGNFSSAAAMSSTVGAPYFAPTVLCA